MGEFHDRAVEYQSAASLTPQKEGTAPSRDAAHPLLHLQRQAGNQSVSSLMEEEESHPVRSVVGSGGGVPLDTGVRHTMEETLGQSFSDVRVHTDQNAADSAKSVQALAYTVGNDIVFQADRYSPDTPQGQRTLAHELTHVAQQRSGPVEGTPEAGGIQLSHPTDRFEQEAERAAETLARQTDPAKTPETAPPPAPAPAAVQRQAEAAPQAPGLVVQRQTEEAEDEDSM
jgi:hypothetical protein